MKEKLKALREQAAQSLEFMKKLKDELKGTDPDKWPSEKEEQFQKAFGDFKEAHVAAQKLEAQIAADEQLTQHYDAYMKPAGENVQGQVQHKAPGPAERFEDAFVAMGWEPRETFGYKPNAPELHAIRTAAARHGAAFFRVWKDAFRTYIATKHADASGYSKWMAMLSPEEKHALLGTVGDLGGFTVPPDFRAEVLKDEAALAAMRGICRVEPTSSTELIFPTIKSDPSDPDRFPSNFRGAFKKQAYVSGGTAPPTQNAPLWGLERVPVHDWQPDAIEVPYQLFEDSAANVDGIIALCIAETKALSEDDAFTNGTGQGEPEGILNSGAPEVNSGAAAALTYSGLVNLYTGLPAQYRPNARFLMTSGTFGNIIKLESTGGFLIFPPNAPPGTLFMKPVVFNEFMPAVAANNKPIIFGDFQKYVIAERQDLRVLRLMERFAPNIALLPVARFGGQAVRLRSFRIHKIAT